MDKKYWIEIVKPQEKEDAENAFNKWKEKNPEIAERLTSEDIRIDTIRSRDKKLLVRYRILTYRGEF